MTPEAQYQVIILDALERINQRSSFKVISDDLDIYAWPQTWSDTSCGFGGYAGQGFTKAQTYVVMNALQSPEAIVYHAGRYAYEVERVYPSFWWAMGRFELPGAKDTKAIERFSDRDAL